MIDRSPALTPADVASQRHPPDGVITVVSGLPRSGTSLLMQMLHAGGMPVLIDDLRPPDQANPLGYFELEAVKQTRQNPAWTTHAAGRAVKVIYRLLRDLPPSLNYRVLFMRRDLDEVVASQQAMLGRPPMAPLERQRLVGVFHRELTEVDYWLNSARHIQLLNIRHAELITQPQAPISRICNFIGRPLDQAAMAAAVRPTLHRQRPERLPPSGSFPDQ